MTLSQLGYEYIRESAQLLRLRDELQQRVAFARGNQLLTLRKQIASLNEMADDCRRTGEQLIAYYRNSSN